MVSGTPIDPAKAQRQDAYHRALAIACPNVEIVKGQFTTHKKLQAVATCPSFPTCGIRVAVRNEKGSDVNLAARLLHDAHLGAYDRAIVVSGDSDLLTEPIRLVTQLVKKAVWVRNPRPVNSQQLAGAASNYEWIRIGVLSASQLPDPVSDGTKIYTRPAKWLVHSAPKTKQNILATTCPLAACGNKIESCRYTQAGHRDRTCQCGRNGVVNPAKMDKKRGFSRNEIWYAICYWV